MTVPFHRYIIGLFSNNACQEGALITFVAAGNAPKSISVSTFLYSKVARAHATTLSASPSTNG